MEEKSGAFVQGATAAATGAIAGAVVIIGRKAIVDLPTAGIAIVSLAILLRVKLPEPLLVAIAGAAGVGLWLATGRKDQYRKRSAASFFEERTHGGKKFFSQLVFRAQQAL